MALHIPPNIPVIVWTDDTHMLSRFAKVFKEREFRYTAYLDKPFNMNQLTSVLKPIIGEDRKEQLQSNATVKIL